MNLFLQNREPDFQSKLETIDKNKDFALSIVDQLKQAYNIKTDISRHGNDRIIVRLNEHSYFVYSAGSIEVNADGVFFEVAVLASDLGKIKSIGPDKVSSDEELRGQKVYGAWELLHYISDNVDQNKAKAKSEELALKLKSLGFTFYRSTCGTTSAHVHLKTNLAGLTDAELNKRIRVIVEAYAVKNVEAKI